MVASLFEYWFINYFSLDLNMTLIIGVKQNDSAFIVFCNVGISCCFLYFMFDNEKN